MLIIDSHCHAGKGDGLTGPWDTRASLKKYLIWSKEAGIQRTNLFSVFNSNYSLANEQVANIVNQYPERFYGFAFVHAERDKGRIFSLVKVAVERFRFVGIKVHRQDARITREICEAAHYYCLPVLYDVMGEVSSIVILAEEFPEVNFIIPHLSSFADDWQSQIAFIPILERYKNIYTDTSGVRRFDLLEMAVKRAGAGKILFGTDGPWLHPKVELEKIKMLELTPSDAEKIMAGNFLKLISRSGKSIHHGKLKLNDEHL